MGRSDAQRGVEAMRSFWSDWPQLVDIVLTTLLFWGVLRSLRRRRQNYRVLWGVAMLAFGYLAANALGLTLASWALFGLLGACVVIAAFTFQEDLRRGLDLLASLGLGRPAPMGDKTMDVLVRAASRMASARTGALIVLPGREPVLPHIQGGVAIDAILSEPLLLSLFDTHSPGHDGALIVRGSLVERFACHLPLSNDEEQLAGSGTRHASALGLSERTDVLCIVVSEERGQISVACQGRLNVVDEGGLRREISRHLGKPSSPSIHAAPTRWHTRLFELGFASAAATLIWFAAVPGGVVVSRTYQLPVVVENLPDGYVVDGVTPRDVQVTVGGPRRAIYLLGEQEVEPAVDAWLVMTGKRRFGIVPSDVRAPEGVQILDVYPRSVLVEITKGPEAKAQP